MRIMSILFVFNLASGACHEVTNNINCPTPDTSGIDTAYPYAPRTDAEGERDEELDEQDTYVLPDIGLDISEELDSWEGSDTIDALDSADSSDMHDSGSIDEPDIQELEPCPILEPGDLFKVPNHTAVYYINAWNERMYFPHQSVYLTWYPDFGGITVVPSYCFNNYPNPALPPFGINFRPGSYLVKIVGSPSVYAILPGNTLAKIGNETAAEALYGQDWKYDVYDVSDFFWPNYANYAEDIIEAVPHDGMLVKTEASQMVWHVEDGALVRVLGALGLLENTVHTVSPETLSTLPFSTGTTTKEEILSDPSQLEE